MTATVRAPAPRPCESCPYRCDVPSGVWAAEEYRRLPLYDGAVWRQLPGLFMCHQADGRLCGGWVGCHGGYELLAVRLAALRGELSGDDLSAALDYRSPVPLFASGGQAARHGLADVESPGLAARVLIARLARKLQPSRHDTRGGQVIGLTGFQPLDVGLRQPEQGSTSMVHGRPEGRA